MENIASQYQHNLETASITLVSFTDLYEALQNVYGIFEVNEDRLAKTVDKIKEDGAIYSTILTVFDTDIDQEFLIGDPYLVLAIEQLTKLGTIEAEVAVVRLVEGGKEAYNTIVAHLPNLDAQLKLRLRDSFGLLTPTEAISKRFIEIAATFPALGNLNRATLRLFCDRIRIRAKQSVSKTDFIYATEAQLEEVAEIVNRFIEVNPVLVTQIDTTFDKLAEQVIISGVIDNNLRDIQRPAPEEKEKVKRQTATEKIADLQAKIARIAELASQGASAEQIKQIIEGEVDA